MLHCPTTRSAVMTDCNWPQLSLSITIQKFISSGKIQTTWWRLILCETSKRDIIELNSLRLWLISMAISIARSVQTRSPSVLKKEENKLVPLPTKSRFLTKWSAKMGNRMITTVFRTRELKDGDCKLMSNLSSMLNQTIIRLKVYISLLMDNLLALTWKRRLWSAGKQRKMWLFIIFLMKLYEKCWELMIHRSVWC